MHESSQITQDQIDALVTKLAAMDWTDDERMLLAAIFETASGLPSDVQGFDVGDDAQLANVDLQNVLQKTQQNLQMVSNISKMYHDTAMAIIRKMGG
jgi:hypothetical protein